uniref:DNA-directed RNA polymerase subunit beta n=1 Tax=Euglena longa TaxID=3037 RepID=RPOB_EUGLO|nr:RNA polymerase beta subunit [Euglena longa]P27059.2 RecName: Full=DNA-directed RNA polymerase subunit beta; AltName: Full=PEP; AltName: Full=Plastid-encoded RNA polymerase subunit beta; Short=RNA polymerase subunit beta [Euglena longa]CAC24573.1 RNA polymerase subunit [Euglena longa]
MINRLKTYSNLLNIQSKSFKNFLKIGIINELKKIQKIIHSNFEINFHINALKYKKPKLSSESCLIKNETYNIDIKIPMEIKYEGKIIFKKKYISFCKIPFMTEKGTFICNGNTRIIINQLIRSPGIYIKKKKNCLLATLIPKTGSWITIKRNKKKENFIKIDKINNSIPLFTFLNILGLSKKKITLSLNKNNYSKNFKISKKKKIEIPTINLTQLSKENNIKTIRNNLYNRFLNSDNYNLGDTGRFKINKKIYKTEFFTNKKILMPEDFLGIFNYMIKIKNINIKSNKIDDLKNKIVLSVGELMQNKFNNIIKDIYTKIIEKINKFEQKKKQEEKYNKEKKEEKIKINKTYFINSKNLTDNIKKFITTNPLSQLLNDLNPLSELTHKRKISTLGIGGIEKNKASTKIREIHNSHYGRICPIETSEGKNAGLVLSLAKDIRINKHGFIESPFYKVIKGNIKKNKGIFFISSENEKNIKIAPCDILKNFKLNKNYGVKNKNEFYYDSYKSINFISTSTDQFNSIGTGIIPFLEHNDANRVLMGATMQKQALILKNKEPSLIETGREILINRDSKSTIIAKESGTVIYSSSKKIIIQKKSKKSKFKNINLFKKYFKKKLKKNKKIKKHKHTIYLLNIDEKNNSNIYQTRTSIVKKNDWIKKGQIIAEGIGSLNGNLCLGKNILVGYLSWEGYNFEDAIIISERLRNEDILTSIHVKKCKSFLINHKEKKEEITKNIPDIKLKNVKNLNNNGIIKIGSKINGKEILIGIIKKRLINYEVELIYEILSEYERKNISVLSPKNLVGIVTNTKIHKIKNCYQIEIYITEKKKIQIGDKLSGRHGNKGVISKIIPIVDMPYLPDGTPIDIILNPLGIPSRMNVGQIYECLLNLSAINLKERYKIQPFDEYQYKNNSEILIYKKLNQSRKKTKKEWLFNPNNPGKTILFNGKNGKPFKQTISFGYSYILKLMHIAEEKIHAKTISNYSSIIKQPVKGKSKNGGQRFGEMEVWAIEGFGAAFLLQELLTIKSDDLHNKSQILKNLMNGLSMSKPNVPESFKLLILELQSLGLNINIFTKKKTLFTK